jgi:hypothetical protein
MITSASKPADRELCAADKISIEDNNLRIAPLKISNFN